MGIMGEKELVRQLYDKLEEVLKSIEEAREILDEEPVAVYKTLITKTTLVLRRIKLEQEVNIGNEFSEAIFPAWDDAYYTVFDKFELKVNQLNWAIVNTTNERKFLREIDKRYDECGLEGTLYNDERYEEALKDLKDLIQDIDEKDKELEDSFSGKIQKNVFYLIGVSITPWLLIGSKLYSNISTIKLIGVLIAVPFSLWLLALFFVVLFPLLSKKVMRKSRRKK